MTTFRIFSFSSIKEIYTYLSVILTCYVWNKIRIASEKIDYSFQSFVKVNCDGSKEYSVIPISIGETDAILIFFPHQFGLQKIDS